MAVRLGLMIVVLMGVLPGCGSERDPRSYSDIATKEIFEALPCAVMNANWDLRLSELERERVRLCERSRHVATTREMLANA